MDEREQATINNNKKRDNQQNKINNNLNESNSNEKYKSKTYTLVKDIQQ